DRLSGLPVDHVIEAVLLAHAHHVAAPDREQVGCGADVGVRAGPAAGDGEDVARGELVDPGHLAGLVVDRDQRITPGARWLLVGRAGADEAELARLVDGGGRPDRHSRPGGRVVLRRVHAPTLLARVGIEAHDAAAERVVGLPDHLLERRYADDDGVAGKGR